MSAPAPEPDIDVAIDCEEWRRVDCARLAGESYAAVADHLPDLDGALSVLFTDDQTIQSLNREFRGKDKPTNVLSFPAGDGPFSLLGDIALAYGVCRDEAERDGISLDAHAAHLLVHGLLHLSGYDHQTDREAARMERLETAILAGMGVDDPYADQTLTTTETV